MSKVMKANEFVNKAIDIAKNYKTLYVLGCFGAPLRKEYKDRYINKNDYNKGRASMIKNASSDTFGFDCVCLIKGILWGWNGDVNKVYGGAVYKANGVDDIGADIIIKSSYCTNVSTNFSNIEVGEIVWLSGHVGIYIGNGQVVECSPAWQNKVQITNLSQRNWKKHGKLKYIDYTKPTAPKKSVDELAREVLDGKWGNGQDRVNRLTQAGYDYNAVQNRVNEILHSKPANTSVTYTVKSGDTLSGIASKYNMSYKDLYAKNKSLIDSENKKRGVATSKMWVYPNQVLKIK